MPGGSLSEARQRLAEAKERVPALTPTPAPAPPPDAQPRGVALQAASARAVAEAEASHGGAGPVQADLGGGALDESERMAQARRSLEALRARKAELAAAAPAPDASPRKHKGGGAKAPAAGAPAAGAPAPVPPYLSQALPLVKHHQLAELQELRRKNRLLEEEIRREVEGCAPRRALRVRLRRPAEGPRAAAP